jgi:hypothetical protein
MDGRRVQRKEYICGESNELGGRPTLRTAALILYFVYLCIHHIFYSLTIDSCFGFSIPSDSECRIRGTHVAFNPKQIPAGQSCYRLAGNNSIGAATVKITCSKSKY